MKKRVVAEKDKMNKMLTLIKQIFISLIKNRVIKHLILLLGAVNGSCIVYLMYMVHKGVYQIDLNEKYAFYCSQYDYDGQAFLFTFLMLVVICVLGWMFILDEERSDLGFFTKVGRFIIAASLLPITGCILYLPYKLIGFHEIALGLDSMSLTSYFIVRCVHTNPEKMDYLLHCLTVKQYKFTELTGSEELKSFSANAVENCKTFSDVRIKCDKLIEDQQLAEQKAFEAARLLAESKNVVTEQNVLDKSISFVTEHPYLVIVGTIVLIGLIWKGATYFSTVSVNEAVAESPQQVVSVDEQQNFSTVSVNEAVAESPQQVASVDEEESPWVKTVNAMLFKPAKPASIYDDVNNRPQVPEFFEIPAVCKGSKYIDITERQHANGAYYYVVWYIDNATDTFVRAL
jgi:hypothetical protein